MSRQSSRAVLSLEKWPERIRQVSREEAFSGTRAKLPNKSRVLTTIPPPLPFFRCNCGALWLYPVPRRDFSYGTRHYSRGGDQTVFRLYVKPSGGPLWEPRDMYWLTRSCPDARVAKWPRWLVARCSACKLLILGPRPEFRWRRALFSAVLPNFPPSLLFDFSDETCNYMK